MSWRRLVVFAVLVALLPASGAVAAPRRGAARIVADTTGMRDRWVEVDLLMFDPDHVATSARRLWRRLGPLFAGASGQVGVMINVGWHPDYILNYTGDPRRRIDMHYFRFRGYRYWTYLQLRHLVHALRAIGDRTLHRRNVMIGTFSLGWDIAYCPGPKHGSVIAGAGNCYETPFRRRHPESYSRRYITSVSGYEWIALYVRLHADHYHYASYPHGIPRGTPLWRLFAHQLAAVSRELGTNVFLYRDGMLGRSDYIRYPLLTRGWLPRLFDGLENSMREVKRIDPQLKLMAYSTATSGIGELRSQSFDLERLAREHLLDYYVSQTYGVAWSDDPGRDTGTTQLSYSLSAQYALAQETQLAGTATRFYTVAEGLDPWEGDWIHTAPGDHRWELWTYSHLAYRRADGSLRIPDGFYISWGDDNHRYFSHRDVRYLASTINRASADARAMTRVYGPTLVYNRAMMTWLDHHDPTANYGEITDETLGMLSKWGLPVMSATRINALSPLSAGEFPIFQTPNQLSPESVREIRQLASLRPTAIFSAPPGIAPALRHLPRVSYWQPPELSLETQPGPAPYLAELALLRARARQAGESYIAGNPPPLGILTLWRSAGRPEVQIANVHEVILGPMPRPHTYTLVLSRRQLGLTQRVYLLHDLFSGALLRPVRSSSSDLTFRVRVAAHFSRLFEVVTPHRKLAPSSSLLPRQIGNPD